MNDPNPPRALRLVAINAGVSDPSSTRMLVDTVVRSTIARLASPGSGPTVSTIDLAPLAVEIARAMVAGFPGEGVKAAIASLAAADGIIAATPVYKAGMSGLFKSFVDLLDNDLLIAKPVVLVATAGTSRHAMVPDEQMRPLFAFLRAMSTPTSIFAGPEDWGSPELSGRVERAAGELAQLMQSGVGHAIAGEGWRAYGHEFAGNATRAERTAADLDFDTDLMRLATGGRLPPR